jgi:hypothetical protein
MSINARVFEGVANATGQTQAGEIGSTRSWPWQAMWLAKSYPPRAGKTRRARCCAAIDMAWLNLENAVDRFKTAGNPDVS